MARRRSDDEDDAPPPRRRPRREVAPDRTWLIAGVGLGVALLVAVVVAGVLYVRGRPKVEETTNEYGEIVTENKIAIDGGHVTEIRTRLPADETPRGVRWEGDQRKADPAVVTEAWKLLAGRWERPGPAGETQVIEFHPDYRVTLPVQEDTGGIKVGTYKLASVTDDSKRFAWDKSGNRRYDIKLRTGKDLYTSITYSCIVLPNGALADAHNSGQPYRRVR